MLISDFLALYGECLPLLDQDMLAKMLDVCGFQRDTKEWCALIIERKKQKAR